MKKLITSADVKSLGSGKKIMYIEPGTIVTPAAKDTAADMGITIKTCPAGEQPVNQDETAANNQPVKREVVSVGSVPAEPVMKIEDIPQNLIAEIVKKVLDSLPGVPKEVPQEDSLVKEIDGTGVILVKGNSVKCESFDTGNPKDKVGLKETMTREQSPHLAAGFMEMEESAFDWTLTYNEMDYVIEGTLDIIVNGKTYRGHAGDVFYIPEGTSITFATPDKCKFFYVTTPWPAFL